MQRNTIWLSFLVIIALISIWFVFQAGSAAIRYLQLSQTAPIAIEKHEIKEIGKDKYAIFVHYSFYHDGKQVFGKGIVGPIYPNPWAAERPLKRLPQQQLSVWFNPKKPVDAVLAKHFPYKQIISGSLIILIGIYFFFIGISARMSNGKG